jgi:hypothetical protein
LEPFTFDDIGLAKAVWPAALVACLTPDDILGMPDHRYSALMGTPDTLPTKFVIVEPATPGYWNLRLIHFPIRPDVFPEETVVPVATANIPLWFWIRGVRDPVSDWEDLPLLSDEDDEDEYEDLDEEEE